MASRDIRVLSREEIVVKCTFSAYVMYSVDIFT